MCFDQAYTGYTIPKPGQTSPNFAGMHCVAPYFADLDTSNSGKVWYQVYDTTTASGLENHVAITTAESLVLDHYGINMEAVLVIKVTWEDVLSYQASAGQVIPVHF